MNFTVVFKSDESQIYTYGLVFIPTICWIDGDCKDNILFNSGGIEYKRGYVKELMTAVNERNRSTGDIGHFDRLNYDDRRCVGGRSPGDINTRHSN